MHEVTIGTRTVECEVCGNAFQAKRSDATTCGATCRKRLNRRRHDPVLTPDDTARRLGTKDGTRKRSAVELLDGIIRQRHVQLEHVLKLADVPLAVTAEDAPLERWDKELTTTIQLLSRVRRAIRDERQRHN